MYLQLPLSQDSGDHSWDSDPEGGGEVVVFQPSGLNVSTYEHFVQAVQFLCSLSSFCFFVCSESVSISLGFLTGFCFCHVFGMQDFPVSCRMILHMWQAGKMTAQHALEQVVQSKDPAGQRAYEAIQWHETQVRSVLSSQRTKHLLEKLNDTLTNFIADPRIDHWLQQFRSESFGTVWRFKLLLLRGASRAGQTLKAQSMFGASRTLVLNCQGLGKFMPSWATLDRAQHDAVVLDEVSEQQVLNNKQLLQSGPRPVSLGQSATNIFAYTIDVYALPIILCSNDFKLSVADGLSTLEEEDWLQANIIEASVPSCGKWYLE